MIYFIQAGTRGPIKIGYTSNNPNNRFSMIQAHSPVKLKFRGVKVGTEADEKKLHIRFAKQHVRGEWFKPSPEMEEIIMNECSPLRNQHNLILAEIEVPTDFREKLKERAGSNWTAELVLLAQRALEQEKAPARLPQPSHD